jgi:hypothetical protein
MRPLCPNIVLEASYPAIQPQSNTIPPFALSDDDFAFQSIYYILIASTQCLHQIALLSGNEPCLPLY